MNFDFYVHTGIKALKQRTKRETEQTNNKENICVKYESRWTQNKCLVLLALIPLLYYIFVHLYL